VRTSRRFARCWKESQLGADDRPANVEKITFVERSLANLPVRAALRGSMFMPSMKKDRCAAERERLTKELEKIEKEQANGSGSFQTSSFWPKHRRKSSRTESTRRRVAVLQEKTVGKLKELG